MIALIAWAWQISKTLLINARYIVGPLKQAHTHYTLTYQATQASQIPGSMPALSIHAVSLDLIPSCGRLTSLIHGYFDQ